MSRLQKVSEVQCKSILSGKPGDYSVNCYVGCEHACVYCYAQFVKRFTGHLEPWGEFVDVKVNAPERLARTRRRNLGRVFVSRSCDGWQPLERDYRLTRQCLEILVEKGAPVRVLTKNALARRDFDVLSGADVHFGVTMTTPDEDVRRLVEPFCSSNAQRLELLAEAKAAGFVPYAMLGPLLPGISDDAAKVKRLVAMVAASGVQYIFYDTLNPRWGVWPTYRAFLRESFPELTDRTRAALFDKEARAAYADALDRNVRAAAARHELRIGG